MSGIADLKFTISDLQATPMLTKTDNAQYPHLYERSSAMSKIPVVYCR